MTLFSLVTIPIMAANGAIETKMMKHEYNQEDSNAAGNIIQENITNIKTVRGINTIDKTIEIFNENIYKKKPKVSSILCGGIIFSLGQSMPYYILAYVFWIGSVCRDNYGVSFKDMFTSIFVLLFAAFGMGFIVSMSGNMAEASDATKRIYLF